MALPSFSRAQIGAKALSIFKKITIAVIIGVVSDSVYEQLDVDSWEKFSTKAQVFNTVMLDNALVLNPFYIAFTSWNRLKTNRYSVEVGGWKAPFNLTQACEDRVFTDVPVPGPLDGLPEFAGIGSRVVKPVYQGPPLPYDCQLDEATRPHQFIEYVLGLPDVVLSAVGNLWGTLPAETITKMGRVYPVVVPLSARIAPWVRRGLLLLAIVMALIQVGQTPKPGEEQLNFFQYIVSNLLLISIGAVVLTGLMSLILWIGDKNNQITAATSGLGTAGIILKAYFDEAKSLVLDTGKEKIEDSLMKKPTA